ncbi:hypothetical protein [Comamonas thiooxydans]|uniref:hypothetical protein n=1 Tax=Comamonas thiooxydans TaxID=363952 RepID=UPI001CCC845B|nr:hypothetical protein [Comamonas thiooxydans]UBQ43421.1 hypothetical protein LCH15_08100 [Comamonas thiooxydans]
MQTTTATQATPRPLLFARHLMGMGIVALANPLIYYSDQPTFRWLETWATPIVLALVAYGLYALFLTQRAKAAWPKSFFILAWVLLTMLVAGPWIDKFRSAPNMAQAHQPAPATQYDPAAARPASKVDNTKPSATGEEQEWWKKGSTPLN